LNSHFIAKVAACLWLDFWQPALKPKIFANIFDQKKLRRTAVIIQAVKSQVIQFLEEELETAD
jgi:hypothetical protein